MFLSIFEIYWELDPPKLSYWVHFFLHSIYFYKGMDLFLTAIKPYGKRWMKSMTDNIISYKPYLSFSEANEQQ